MPIVRMPDGALVRFPDDMPQDEIGGQIQKWYPDAFASAEPEPAPQAAAPQATQAPQVGASSFSAPEFEDPEAAMFSGSRNEKPMQFQSDMGGSVFERTAPTQQTSPMRPEFRQQIQRSFDAATPDQRSRMLNPETSAGRVAIQRNQAYDDLQAKIDQTNAESPLNNILGTEARPDLVDIDGRLEARSKKIQREEGFEKGVADALAFRQAYDGNTGIASLSQTQDEGLIEQALRQTGDLGLSVGAGAVNTAKLLTDVGRLATGDSEGLQGISELLGQGSEAIGDLRSTGFKVQEEEFNRMMESRGIGGAPEFFATNPAYFLSKASESLATMLPVLKGAQLTQAAARSLQAVKLLPAAKQAEVLAKVGEGSVVTISGLLNAADAFDSTEGDLGAKYAAAGIAFAGSLVGGKLTKGGAEGALLGGAQRATAGSAIANLGKTVGRESLQEAFEGGSVELGKQIGEGKGVDPRKVLEQAGLEALLGGPVGLIAGASNELSNIVNNPERMLARELAKDIKSFDLPQTTEGQILRQSALESPTVRPEVTSNIATPSVPEQTTPAAEPLLGNVPGTSEEPAMPSASGASSPDLIRASQTRTFASEREAMVAARSAGVENPTIVAEQAGRFSWKAPETPRLIESVLNENPELYGAAPATPATTVQPAASVATGTTQTASSLPTQNTAIAMDSSPVAMSLRKIVNEFGTKVGRAPDVANVEDVVFRQADTGLDALGRALGVEVVMFDTVDDNGNVTTDKYLFNGAYKDGRVYIRGSGADNPALAIFGHEWYHSLERRAPGLAKKFSDQWQLYRNTAEWDSYKQVLLGRGYTERQLESESAADMFGLITSDPNFMRTLAKEEPTLFKSIVDSIKRLLDQVLNFGPTQQEELAPMIAEYQQLFETAVSIAKEYGIAVQQGTTDQFKQQSQDQDVPFSLQGQANTDAIAQGELSTRQPTAKKPQEDAVNQVLFADYDALKKSPTLLEKVAKVVRTYPGVGGKRIKDNERFLENFIREVVDNLLWLHDQVPQDIRDRSKLWYDGANQIAVRFGQRWNVSQQQAAGMLAVLSPQKDWFQNVSAAERVGDILTYEQNTKFDEKMYKYAMDKYSERWQARVQKMLGKPLSKMSMADKALFVRTFSEVYHNKAYAIVSPEGDFLDYNKTQKGKNSNIAWGSFGEIGKAVSIYYDGSRENLNKQMGSQHKVRNFYNNINTPKSVNGHVTIDTHAVAAGLLRPLAGKSIEVKHNFGGSGKDAATGLGGTYAVYAEAYERAAKQRGLLAREMQSITWEAVRGLYTAPFKSKSENVAQINKVWNTYGSGKLSIDEARNESVAIAGGIENPSWVGSDSGGNAGGFDSSYESKLSRPYARRQGQDRSGLGRRAAGNDSGLAEVNETPFSTGDRDGRRNEARSGDAGSNGSVVGKNTGVEGPSYAFNDPAPGAVRVYAVHYSKTERTELNGKFYGTGLRGAERKRLENSEDPRLNQRVYFYADAGKGIRPEAGVGTKAHKTTLENIYDPSTRLVQSSGNANDFESAVLDAGYDGYVTDFGNQKAVVLMGAAAQSVPTQFDQGSSNEQQRFSIPESRSGNGRGQQGGLGTQALPGAPSVKGATGPDPRLVEVAKQYAKDNGIDFKRQAQYVEVDPARATRIAREFERMEHAPNDPAVIEAYQSMMAQTMAQYKALEQAGYRFWFLDPENDIYEGNPWNAMRDLRNTQSMGVFPTEAGFGSGNTTYPGNPLETPTELRWPYGGPNGPMRRVYANDLFRAVHDAFGHGLEGAGFRDRGEENAWQAHVRLYTGAAVGAVTSETRGQNSWLNFGPYAETNRIARVEETVFAPQKMGLMPEWTWREGRVGNESEAADDAAFSIPSRKQTQTPEFKRWFGDSKVVDSNGEPLVMYTGTSKDVDFTKFKVPKNGAWFTPDPEAASMYAKDNDSRNSKYNPQTRRYEEINTASRVMPVYLKIENPYTPTAEEMQQMITASNYKRVQGQIFEKAKFRGFDGVDMGDGIWVVIGKPNQIKSAIGNNGNFDSAKDDIRFSIPNRKQTETPAFKAFFDGSVVVDDSGQPMVQYHSTYSDFSEFQVDFGRDSWKKFGAHFGSLEAATNRIAIKAGEDERNMERSGNAAPNIMPVYLAIRKPLRLPENRTGRWGVDDIMRAIMDGADAGTVDVPDNLVEDYYADELQINGEMWADAQPEEQAGMLRDFLSRTLGVDGIVYANEFEGGGDSYIVWNKSQIKSAIGNNGNFDDFEDDIRFSTPQRKIGPNGMYSKLLDVVQNVPAKLREQPAPQWKAWLMSNAAKMGVKKDEMEWSGVMDYLDLAGKEKVEAEGIAQYLEENGVQVEEVTLGAVDTARPSVEFRDGEYNIVNQAGEILDSYRGDAQGEQDAIRAAEEWNNREYSNTKYGGYTLPGGKNYREVLLTLPSKNDDLDWVKKQESKYGKNIMNWPEAVANELDLRRSKINKAESQQYKSSHWDQPNVIAHIRLNDRTDADGNKVLFIEEVQSDWGQEGKKKGFAKPTLSEQQRQEKIAEAKRLTAAIRQRADADRAAGLEQISDETLAVNKADSLRVSSIMREIDDDKMTTKMNSIKVPRAPFVTDTKGWLGLSLKRIITMAVQGGYDKVAFINGQQSADRYDLSKQVDSISWAETDAGLFNIGAFKDGSLAIGEDDLTIDEVGDMLGKEIADKIKRDSETNVAGELSGVDLKVGGKGMIAFYDQIVPQEVRGLLKKFGGGQMEMVDLDVGLNSTNQYEIKEREDGSFALRGRADSNSGWAPFGVYQTRDQARNRMEELQRDSEFNGQPGFTVTPELRQIVEEEGLPLFSIPRRKQEESAQFQAWTEGLPVIEPDSTEDYAGGGAVFKVYHGSTFSDISVVDTSRGNKDGAMGAGFYTSTSIDDVNANYAGFGPDLTNRIQLESESLSDAFYEDDYNAEDMLRDYFDAKEMDIEIDDSNLEELKDEYGQKAIEFAAKKTIAGDNQGVVMPLYVKTKNPFDARPGAMYFDSPYTINRETDDYEDNEESNGFKIQQAINTVAAQYDLERNSDFDELLIDGTTAYELFEVAKKLNIYDDMGDLVSGGQFMQDVAREAGYDAFIMDADDAFGSGRRNPMGFRANAMKGVNPGTLHIMPFDRKNVKSVTGNNGEFSDNPDIRFSAPQSKSQRNRLVMKDQNAADRGIFNNYSDKFLRLEQVEAFVTKKVGPIKVNGREISPYKKQERYPGVRAELRNDFIAQEVQPLLLALKKAATSADRLMTYRYALHAEERNQSIARRNKLMPDGGSGMLTQTSKDLLNGVDSEWEVEGVGKVKVKGFAPEERAKLDALMPELDKLINGTRDLLVNAGLESQDTIDAIRGVYKHWIPLAGKEDSADDGMMRGVGTGFSVFGSTLRVALGRQTAATDILGQVVQMREQAIDRFQKNEALKEVMQYFYELQSQGVDLVGSDNTLLVQINPTDTVRYFRKGTVEDFRADAAQALGKANQAVTPAEIEKYVNDRMFGGKASQQRVQSFIQFQAGTVNTRDFPAKMAENVSAMRVNGKDVLIRFNDPILAKAFRNMDAQQLGFVMTNIMRPATGYFRNIYTAYNPFFWATNLLRDVGATTFGAIQDGYTMPFRVLANMPAAFGHAAKGLYGQGSQVWDDFRLSGSRTGFVTSYRNARDRQAELLAEFGPSNPLKQGAALGKKLLNYFLTINSVFEDGVRLALFMSERQIGKSVDEAADAVRRISVNFNRKGFDSDRASSMYVFFNAAAQGSRTMKRALQTKEGMVGAAALVSLSTAMNMITALALGEDDDGEPLWNSEAVRNDRQNNILIPTFDPERPYILIPLQYGLNAIWNMGAVVPSLYMTKDSDKPRQAVKEAIQVGKGFADGFLPPPIGGLFKQGAGALVPTIAQPIAQPLLNTNGFGRTIVPGTSDQPRNERMFKSTRDSVYDNFVSTVNERLGGTPNDPVFEVSPEDVKNFMSVMFGSFNSTVLQMTAENKRGRETDVLDNPFLRKFVANPDRLEQDDIGKFYERQRELDAAAKDIKVFRERGEFDKAKEIASKPEMSMRKKAGKIRERLGKLRDRRIELMRNNNISDIERQSKLRELDLIEQQMVDGFNRQYNTVTGLIEGE